MTEPDPRVRLAIEFALLRLGESRYLAALQAGLRDSDTRLVEYATILTHWLPYDLELEFSEESLSEVVTNKALPVGLRFVAVLIFLEIGAKRPLSEQTLQLLLNFVREIRDKPEPLELFARGFAKLEQLDRARVLVELRKSNALVEPWLERFAKLALPADLVLLDKLFRSGAYTTPHLHVARVAAAIPGADAQTTLQRWFADYPRLRTSILFLLILRPDVDKPRLHHLLSRIGGAHEFTFALASGEASLRAAARYTSGSNIEERQEVMLALRFFGSTLYRKMLWPSASYYDDRSYPAEVRVRQLALTALIDLELNRSDRPVAAQPAAEGLALEMTSELIDERGSFPLPQLPEPSGELHLRAPAEVRGDPLSIEAIRAGALRGNHARLTPPSLAR